MSRIIDSPPDVPPDDHGVKPAGWWQESEDGKRILCGLCPRACSLGPGDRGFCFVRQNLGGRMVTTTYGRSTGFCVDPIEKKPLNHFYPGTAVLSFGTAGCNLGCNFCQNWNQSRSRDVDAACEVADPQTIAEAALKLGCRSVALTYNDPIVFAEYAIDTAKACHAAGVKTVAVTSGYITPAAREAFYQHIDAANVDLKGFTEDFYHRLTGGHLEPVLDTLRWLAGRRSTWLEITNLVIPRANDAPDDIRRMCQWICQTLGPDVPLHFSAFHPDFKLTDREPTPLATLLRAHEIAREAGLRYVYTGNVVDREHQSTLCPGCGRAVIERDGYTIGAFELRGGVCRHCRTPIPGHFDDAPGDWGGRRLPVRIAAYASASRGVTGATVGLSNRVSSTAGQASSGTQSVKPSLTEHYARPESHAPEPKEETPVASEPVPTPKPLAERGIRPQLTEEQERLVFQAASRRVAEVVRLQTLEPVETLLADIGSTAVYGAFVSLKRAGQLRSCCGFLGQSVPLAEALGHAAIRAAKEDPRFPPISPTELDHLDMEVWLLWGLEPVAAKGEDRVGAVTIGTHGLQIARGPARGLLLPGVAVDHHLDARAFLKQVCLKAGLPPDAWKQDDTALMTFEGYAIRGRLEAPAGAAAPADGWTGGPTRDELAALARFCRANLIALLQGATPSFYLAGGYDGGVHGVAMTVGARGTAGAIECSQLSLRVEIPLQATLFKLCETAARTLAARRTDPQSLHSAPLALAVLRDPAMHGTADGPQLQGIDARRRAVLVIDASRSAWVFDPEKTPEQLVAEALRQGGFSDPARANVISLAAAATEPRMGIAYVPRPEPGPNVRPPAVAGAFYPSLPEEIQSELDRMFPDRPQPEAWAGVMVPHAGWMYSGRLAAKVFSRVQIPPQVIVLCPKHHPGGADWAVAPHATWALPGMQVASDPDLARRLAAAISGLELDATPQRQEHAVEVQLPLLARLAPHVRVVGITVGGGGNLADLQQFGRQLAEVLKDMPQRPLLVISSDMNHFADEAETRRLDRLALDALESLDPARLYATVRENHISMCGMYAAVVVMETLRHLDSLHRCELVGYATSAAASGDTQRVVGYAGMLLG